MAAQLYIGIDLGGTNIKTVILNAAFDQVESCSFETQDSHTKPEVWRNKIGAHIDSVKSRYPAALLSVGIAAPGLADEKNETIKQLPGRLQGIENLHWSTITRLKTRVLNDAHAACLGELKKGVAQGMQHVVMITLGTGVGGAIVMDGKLYQGVHGRAGHFGHMTVDYAGETSSTHMVGSLESAIGNQSVSLRTKSQYNSTDELVMAYCNGEENASYWWLQSVHKLACALSSLINAFSPEIIVIGGGIANANDALFKPLEKFMGLYEWRPNNYSTPIRKAQLGEYAGAIGAAIFSQLDQE